jgi:acetyl-CoA carboxylase biotin carboxylase subunit
MFKKILIANRGEIAMRVIRACREMGIRSIAVYSEADRNSLHVLLADDAYYLGPAPSAESYLNIDRIIEVIKKSGAEAVHPGYGFLSENAEFARRLKEVGVEFIGPSIASLKDMGDKLSARNLMKKANVPIVPGSVGAIKDIADLKTTAKEVGYPLLIKASAGGGGKGMRLVTKDEELESAFEMASSEAQKFFGNPAVYIERFIQNPKHIEIQVFGDKHGNVVHLYERECSIQRRHQKIIEESPSPAVPQEVREKMGQIAVAAAKSINYIGAGTFEFIFDSITKEFFFMEMNTRLQVEHPVTEMVTSRDLVREQINVAFGAKLSFEQKDIKQVGHAIEARICAEDPETFAPSPGLIRRCRNPQGPFIRCDSYAYPGYEVPIYYDPMLAKLIAWGETREIAISRLSRALDEYSLTGIKTNITLHKSILEEEEFLNGKYTTQSLEKDFKHRADVFRFVDDRVFLIALAIEAYKQKKKTSVSNLNLQSKWKDIGRKDSMR